MTHLWQHERVQVAIQRDNRQNLAGHLAAYMDTLIMEQFRRLQSLSVGMCCVFGYAFTRFKNVETIGNQLEYLAILCNIFFASSRSAKLPADIPSGFYFKPMR